MAIANHHISFINWRVPIRHHPSAFLLAAQLLSLALYVALDGIPKGRELLGAFGILVLVLVFWVINRSATVRWIAWVLVVPAFVLSLLSALVANSTLLAWSSLLEAVLYFYAAGSLIAYMMGDTQVTADELFAAGATFTLLAWGFANLYLVCQAWSPGSFISVIPPGQPQTFVEFLSLSFTNLSATGLGDILPVSAPARVLVMLEQFSGVAYIAVVVSRLIGMTIARRKKKDPPEIPSQSTMSLRGSAVTEVISSREDCFAREARRDNCSGLAAQCDIQAISQQVEVFRQDLIQVGGRLVDDIHPNLGEAGR